MKCLATRINITVRCTPQEELNRWNGHLSLKDVFVISPNSPIWTKGAFPGIFTATFKDGNHRGDVLLELGKININSIQINSKKGKISIWSDISKWKGSHIEIGKIEFTNDGTLKKIQKLIHHRNYWIRKPKPLIINKD